MSNAAHPEIGTQILADLYAQGFSLLQVGKMCGMTHTGVMCRLRTAGVARRPGFTKINTPALRARKLMLSRARLASERLGLPFNIELTDIVIPNVCPVFGIALRFTPGEGRNDGSPSLDRLVPANGYVKGNIWVISLRANRIKNDASLAELQSLVLALESKYMEAQNGR